MAFDVQWDDPEKTNIIMTVTGTWTWQDLQASMAEARGLLDTVDYRVDFIVDLSGTRVMPPNPLQHGRQRPSDRHPNTGNMAYVGASSFVHALFSVLSRLMPDMGRDFLFAESIEEAREQLAAHRAADA